MSNREAIVHLRPPTHLGLRPSPFTYEPCPLKWLDFGIVWHVTFSTFDHITSRRNVRIELRLPKEEAQESSSPSAPAAPAAPVRPPVLSCETTWQVQSPPAEAPIELSRSSFLPLDYRHAGGTATRFECPETGHQWEIMAWGYEGQLESWMVDLEDGLIGDGSGETRPDWRNRFVVVYYPAARPGGGRGSGKEEGGGQAAAGEGEGEGGIEIWDRFAHWNWGRLTAETRRRILDALEGVRNDEFRTLARRLRPVPVDQGRKEDDERRAALGLNT